MNRTDDYVWYVSYGSNMLRERFLHYIKGGAYEAGGACHEPCADTTPPREVRAFDIPFDMYFGNTSRSWEGKGVSFLDINTPGSAKGVAYLITREQFAHVACQENDGKKPEDNPNWYNVAVSFGTCGGYDVVTVTNDSLRPYNRPGEAYLETLARGLRENYPGMSDDDIRTYLNACDRTPKGELSEAE